MKRKCISLLLIITFVIAFVPGLGQPTEANAKVRKHVLSYDYSPTYTLLDTVFAQQNIKDNKTFKIPNKIPSYGNWRFVFKGYKAYRVKDKKWYISGQGWKSSSKGAKLYSPGASYKFNSSWTKGCKNSNYIFYSKYEYIHNFNVYNQPYKKGVKPVVSKNVRDNCYLTLPGSPGKRNGDSFLGWKAYRKADKTYYVAGKGWLTTKQMADYGYEYKLYQPGDSLKINNSWTQGSEYSNYSFYPVWGTYLYVGF